MERKKKKEGKSNKGKSRHNFFLMKELVSRKNNFSSRLVFPFGVSINKRFHMEAEVLHPNVAWNWLERSGREAQSSKEKGKEREGGG